MPNAKKKQRWIKVMKFFQGGSSEFQLKIPAGRLPKGSIREVLQWVGENTDGGHNYGYRVYARRLREKHKKLKVLDYPDCLL